MTWHTWKSALALGAVLTAAGAASAGDRDTMLLSGGPAKGSTTMTLGGQGTAAKAATEDNELARGYHGGHYGGFHGGHYGWGGGYGYRGGYYGGYRGGYYGGYRGYGYGGYYRPYYSGFYRPYYGYGYGLGYGGLGYGLGYGGLGYGLGYGGYGGYGGLGYGGYYTNYYNSYYPSYGGCGIYIGISGDTAGSGATTVPLGTDFSRPSTPMTQPTPPSGTFPYDGGPSNPVPLPKADPQPIPTIPGASATDLPISVKPKTTPSRYKAYGEK